MEALLNIHFLDIWLEHPNLFEWCNLLWNISVKIIVHRVFSIECRLRELPLITSASTSTSYVVPISTHEDIVTVDNLSHLSFLNHSLTTLILGWSNTPSGRTTNVSSSLIFLEKVANSWLSVLLELANRSWALVVLMRVIECILSKRSILWMILLWHVMVRFTIW